jgi:hypothetical protein
MPDPAAAIGISFGLFEVLFVAVLAIAVVAIVRSVAGFLARGAADWSVVVEPELLQAGAQGIVRARWRPGRAVRHEGIRAELSCVERVVYETHATDAQGHSRTQRNTATETIHAVTTQLAPAGTVGADGEEWSFPVTIPALAPPSYPGETLRITWLLRVLASVGGPDLASNVELSVGAPVERLSAGVFRLEAGAPMIEVTVEGGGSIAVEPVPFDLETGGRATLALPPAPADSRGVRVTLLSDATVTRAGGVASSAVVAERTLPVSAVPGVVELAGPFAPLPDLDSPNGRARGRLVVTYDVPNALDETFERPLALVRGHLDGPVRWDPPGG